MKIPIKKIISKHISKMRKVDCDQPVPKMVKLVDSINQETLRELYDLIDIRKNPVIMDKRGHCC